MNNEELCKFLKSMPPFFDGKFYSILFVDDECLSDRSLTSLYYDATMVVTKSGKIIKNRYGPIDEIKI